MGPISLKLLLEENHISDRTRTMVKVYKCLKYTMPNLAPPSHIVHSNHCQATQELLQLYCLLRVERIYFGSFQETSLFYSCKKGVVFIPQFIL